MSLSSCFRFPFFLFPDDMSAALSLVLSAIDSSILDSDLCENLVSTPWVRFSYTSVKRILLAEG
jgi:hypothetical protein